MSKALSSTTGMVSSDQYLSDTFAERALKGFEPRVRIYLVSPKGDTKIRVNTKAQLRLNSHLFIKGWSVKGYGPRSSGSVYARGMGEKKM